MPKKLETSKKRLSIFDAPPQPEKFVNTKDVLFKAVKEKYDEDLRNALNDKERDLLTKDFEATKQRYLTERKNPVPKKEIQNPRIDLPSFPRPEDVVERLGPEDIAKRKPEHPEDIEKLIEKKINRIDEISFNLKQLDPVNKDDIKSLIDEKKKINQHIQYLVSLNPRYVDLIPSEERINFNGEESSQDVLKKRKDVVEYAINKKPSTLNFTLEESLYEDINRVDSKLRELGNDSELGKLIKTIYENDLSNIGSSGKIKIPKRSLRWEAKEREENGKTVVEWEPQGPKEEINNKSAKSLNIIQRLRTLNQKLSTAEDHIKMINADIQRLQNIPNEQAKRLEEAKLKLEEADPKGDIRKKLETSRTLGLPVTGPVSEEKNISAVRDLLQEIQGLEKEIQSAPAKIEKNIQWLQKQLQTIEADPDAWESREKEMTKIPKSQEPTEKSNLDSRKQKDDSRKQKEQLIQNAKTVINFLVIIWICGKKNTEKLL